MLARQLKSVSKTVKLNQALKRAYALRLGSAAPNFQCDSTKGELDFYDYLGDSWGLLLSHPADYTPVCTTELGAASALQDEWEKRNVKVLALSVDSVEDHLGWAKDVDETSNSTMTYPILADTDRKISKAYNMLPELEGDQTDMDVFTSRAVFIVDPEKKLRLTINYPASTGRNFDEIIRVIDSLQATNGKPLATPMNWQKGDDFIIAPHVTNEEAAKLFPKGFKEVLPYLRYTPDPEA